ncbi:MAG: glycoside hydrolase family 95 protein [Clostridiales bacterium]|nr:glycoside hydrolase family 95 protein [Clostridiales bacterium]
MNKNTLYLDFPATEWELASPIGNGYSGAMIYGGVSCERIQLSEESIWSGGKMDTASPEFRTKIDKIRELLLSGDAPAADEYATNALEDSFYRIQSQETAGELLIDFDADNNYSDYRRELDLLNGTSCVSYSADGSEQKRVAFASYPDKVIAMRHTGVHSARISYVRRDLNKKGEPTGTDERVGVESITFEGNVMTVKAHPVVGGREFYIKLCVVTDGKLTVEGESFVVTDALATEYYIAIGVGYVPTIPDDGFDTLFARSCSDHVELMGRSDIEFGEDEFAELPVNRRLERLKNDPSAVDTGLMALYFRFGKYLLVGSSREGSLPANLQGVWNGYIEAPWNNDYHTNINLQMNYWHAEVANISECALPLFDYMNNYLLESGRETAKVNYHCRGTVLHHLSDIYGFTAPADGLWGLWPLGGAWLCYSMWEHYLFTCDTAYLRDTAYEYIRDCARFFLDYMFEDENGRLLSGPSTSPENRYYSAPCKEGTPKSERPKSAYLCLSPSMDIEIIGGLLRMYIETEELLGINPEWADEARAALKKMPPLRVGKHGQLMEWLEDYDEPEPGHRHVSHLFALYPDCAISVDTPDLYAAAKKTLERRLANGGGHTGWSCAWLIALYARLCDKDGVSSTIRKLLCNSTRESLFDSHPPFQIDGNFGASAALAETLIQSHNGKIVLLPACPDEYAKAGSFTRLRARGGVEVSAKWINGVVTSCTMSAVCSDYEGVAVINGKEYPLSLKCGETVNII